MRERAYRLLDLSVDVYTLYGQSYFRTQNICVRMCVFQPAPRINGPCDSTSATTRSLTFGWRSASSATLYRLVGHSKSQSSTTNTITVDDLTPGSRYTFTVWAVGSQRLVSNNITCTDSTGLSGIFLTSNVLLACSMYELVL